MDLLWNEINHMQEVNKILTDFLLYFPHDPRFDPSEHDRYWDEIRPDYMCEADTRSIWDHYTGWSFLGLMTRGHKFYDSLNKEVAAMREKHLQMKHIEQGVAPNP